MTKATKALYTYKISRDRNCKRFLKICVFVERTDKGRGLDKRELNGINSMSNK